MSVVRIILSWLFALLQRLVVIVLGIIWDITDHLRSGSWGGVAGHNRFILRPAASWP